MPSLLVHLNAALNATAFVLLVVGLVLIKQRRINAHRNVMISAFAVSAVFLVFYLLDKAIKRGVHTPYNGEGLIKSLYYVMLITHIILAAAVPVFAIWLIRLGLKRNDAKHRRIAHIAYPIWMYVSITGVLIYLMLYWFNPG
jgi:putative membrane protein